jgi:two-component system, OmpR family, sensor histidine kinase QseC
VSLRHDDALLHLTGQDDGPGIAATERNRVFERFYRGVGHAANGSGLDLAIVQQAVRRIGGQVKVGDGLNGKGVGFFVSIPLPYST